MFTPPPRGYAVRVWISSVGEGKLIAKQFTCLLLPLYRSVVFVMDTVATSHGRLRFDFFFRCFFFLKSKKPASLGEISLCCPMGQQYLVRYRSLDTVKHSQHKKKTSKGACPLKNPPSFRLTLLTAVRLTTSLPCTVAICMANRGAYKVIARDFVW